ncbi:unnamed protein product [Cercospora beticola]|nr:unnamed protein product [Cercospora beticola]
MVRRITLPLAQQNGSFWSVTISSGGSKGASNYYSNPNGWLYEVLIHMHRPMPFTNGFVSHPADMMQHITQSCLRKATQVIGVFMRSSSEPLPMLVFPVRKEENLVLSDRFAHMSGGWVHFSDTVITAQRLNKKGTDPVTYTAHHRLLLGDRELSEDMHELRNAHLPEVAIYINMILRGPDRLTATQDNWESWERYWKSKRVYITVYVYQKQVSDDVAATPFWRNYMTWNARMDGYFSGPSTDLCSCEARILSKERAWSGCR